MTLTFIYIVLCRIDSVRDAPSDCVIKARKSDVQRRTVYILVGTMG